LGVRCVFRAFIYGQQSNSARLICSRPYPLKQATFVATYLPQGHSPKAQIDIIDLRVLHCLLSPGLFAVPPQRDVIRNIDHPCDEKGVTANSIKKENNITYLEIIVYPEFRSGNKSCHKNIGSGILGGPFL
jgi:hypothetical protein